MAIGSIRRLAELWLGPTVVRRRLPPEAGGGCLFASGKVGGLKYLLKPATRWDPELLGIARLLVRRGQIIWDVGANVGLFSSAAAFHAGPQGGVIAMEADLDAAVLLNRTARCQPPTHAAITVLPLAISDSIGFVRFSIANRARAANSIEGYGSTQTGGVAETRVLPSFALDNVLDHFPPPDVLKIDVEGAELRVLAGAERLLSQARPVLYCEVSSATRSEVTVLLEKFSYKLWDGSRFDGSLSGASDVATENAVAIPQEKVAQVLASP